jgi:hypothetical protein
LYARLADETERLREERVRLVKANEGWHLRVRELNTENTAWSQSDERLREALEIIANTPSVESQPFGAACRATARDALHTDAASAPTRHPEAKQAENAE